MNKRLELLRQQAEYLSETVKLLESTELPKGESTCLYDLQENSCTQNEIGVYKKVLESYEDEMYIVNLEQWTNLLEETEEQLKNVMTVDQLYNRLDR